MTRVKQFVYFWMPAIAYMATIFYLSQQSHPTGDVTIPLSDVILHACEYMPLPYLIMRALRTLRPFSASERKVFITACIAAILYAISDEIHQSFIPLRSADILDVASDTVGILTGALVLRKLRI